MAPRGQRPGCLLLKQFIYCMFVVNNGFLSLTILRTRGRLVCESWQRCCPLTLTAAAAVGSPPGPQLIHSPSHEIQPSWTTTITFNKPELPCCSSPLRVYSYRQRHFFLQTVIRCLRVYPALSRPRGNGGFITEPRQHRRFATA
jgi:hypothetical protein